MKHLGLCYRNVKKGEIFTSNLIRLWNFRCIIFWHSTEFWYSFIVSIVKLQRYLRISTYTRNFRKIVKTRYLELPTQVNISNLYHHQTPTSQIIIKARRVIFLENIAIPECLSYFRNEKRHPDNKSARAASLEPSLTYTNSRVYLLGVSQTSWEHRRVKGSAGR